MRKITVFGKLGRIAALFATALMLLGLLGACTPEYVAKKDGTCNRGRKWMPPSDANKLPSGEKAAGKCDYVNK